MKFVTNYLLNYYEIDYLMNGVFQIDHRMIFSE